MSEYFKEYQASNKGKELIALLFPMNNSDREKTWSTIGKNIQMKQPQLPKVFIIY